MAGTVLPANAGNRVGDNAPCVVFDWGAHPPPGSGGVCNTDNGGGYVHRSDVGPRTQNAIHQTLAGSWGTISNITDGYVSNPHGTTDIYYEFENLDDRGPAVWGVYWCLTGNSDPAECDHAHIAFDPEGGAGGIGDFTDPQLRAIACHETGHALGQTHPEDASPPAARHPTFQCMNTHPANEFPMVGGHNVADIEANSHY